MKRDVCKIVVVEQDKDEEGEEEEEGGKRSSCKLEMHDKQRIGQRN
jgi:hypothetical protein